MSRQLRDKLIAEDRMKLAINVATKCNIESEPGKIQNTMTLSAAWAAWGLSLLKMGSYVDAKEKFTYCLGMRNGLYVIYRSSSV